MNDNYNYIYSVYDFDNKEMLGYKGFTDENKRSFVIDFIILDINMNENKDIEFIINKYVERI